MGSLPGYCNNGHMTLLIPAVQLGSCQCHCSKTNQAIATCALFLAAARNQRHGRPLFYFIPVKHVMFWQCFREHVVFELKLCGVPKCRISSFSDNIIKTTDTILSLIHKAQFLFYFGLECNKVPHKECVTMTTLLF